MAKILREDSPFNRRVAELFKFMEDHNLMITFDGEHTVISNLVKDDLDIGDLYLVEAEDKSTPINVLVPSIDWKLKLASQE